MKSSSSGRRRGDGPTHEIRVPAALGERLDREGTLGLVELLDTERTRWSEQVLSAAADRFERRLTEQVSAVRGELHESLVAIRHEIATTRVELLKWSFVFWVGQVAVV